MKLILLLTCLLLLASSCGDSQTGVTSREKESSPTSEDTGWNIYTRDVKKGDPKYPFEVIEDGYKVSELSRTEGLKSRGAQRVGANMVEWRWKLTVKNKSRKDVRANVTYVLKDEGSRTVASDHSWGWQLVKPGETVTIQGTSTMDYDKAQTVVGSSWDISYR